MFYRNLGWMAMAAVMSIGCIPNNVDPSKMTEAPAGAEEATAAIVAFYGIERAAPPTVVWYGGENVLTCTDPANKPFCGTGGICWHSDNGAGCTAGETLKDGVVLVSTYSYLVPLHETPLAHEIGHYASEVREGNPDTNHTGHFFRDGGDVDQATATLASLGM